MGPSRSVIVLTAAAGGLLSGLGIVFWTVSSPSLGRVSWTDYLPYGRRRGDHLSRRAEDHQRNRRETDPLPSTRAEDPVEFAPAIATPEDERRTGEQVESPPAVTTPESERRTGYDRRKITPRPTPPMNPPPKT